MPDESVQTVANGTSPPADVPPAGNAPVPPQDALDETGVPYKNRIAEERRKREELAEQMRQMQELNLQYQRALGAQQQQAQPQQPNSRRRPEEMFDEDTLSGIQMLIDKKANEIFQRAQISQQLNDQDIARQAQQEYQAIVNNPLYADWPDASRQMLAVKEAQLKLMQQKQQTTSQNQTQQAMEDARRQQSQAASLPVTPGAGGRPSSAEDKDRFIAEFMAKPEERDNVQRLWDVDPDSKEGQDHLRRVAERKYNGGAFIPSSKLMSEFLNYASTKQTGRL